MLLVHWMHILGLEIFHLDKNGGYWFIGWTNWDNNSSHVTESEVTDALDAKIWTIILLLGKDQRLLMH